MRRNHVTVLGSGFAGSLTAIVVRQLGHACTLIDRAEHPRFAIGESSTPTANLVLASLARRFDLPWLSSLAKYGTWQDAFPDLVCGIKRGFSYFDHQADAPFQPDKLHATELLVSASDNDRSADTQWLRADVDRFFCERAVAAGVELLERTEVERVRRPGRWQLDLQPVSGSAPAGQAQPRTLETDLLIDASGAGQVLARQFEIDDEADRMRTSSRALYSHWEDVRPWRDVYRELGGATEDHPYDCDHAAVHHLIDEGWMWMLRFNQGTTSVGFALATSPKRSPDGNTVEPGDEWARLVARYPSIAEQLAHAGLSDVPGRVIRTGRLQRRAAQAAGPGWAMLPHAAGFVDPLHSTGIAHTLCGVERLALILQQHGAAGNAVDAALRNYGQAILNELDLIDQLVAACYAARTSFPLFVSCSMLYFAAATMYELRRVERGNGAATPLGFLCADDPRWRATVYAVEGQLHATLAAGATPSVVEHFERFVADQLQPFNHVGLCDPTVHNIYHHTIAPE